MSWYTINDPSCKFAKINGKIYGEINGRVYELGEGGFSHAKVAKNPYMPDEITDTMIMHARMIPHHFAYAKEKAKRVRKKILRRNGPFIPSEVKDIAKTHVKMIPHHFAYAKGMIQSLRDR